MGKEHDITSSTFSGFFVIFAKYIIYDFTYKGCKSCFACKLIDDNSYGQCSINYEISPILKKLKRRKEVFP